MLWPPSAAPYLYPLPIHGEASNHSGVDIALPDYNLHPLFKKALGYAKVVTLRTGDALFIPEGWYHQVDNVGITIAVNFWWPSNISLALGSQMDGYLLRRVISSLLDSEKKRILKDGIETCVQRTETHLTARNLQFQEDLVWSKSQYCKLNSEEQDRKLSSREFSQVDEGAQASFEGGHPGNQHLKLDGLTEEETFYLKMLVTSALDKTKLPPAASSKLLRTSIDCVQGHDAEVDSTRRQPTYQRRTKFEDDLLCGVFANLRAFSLQRVLLVMAIKFPHSLRVLIMDSLSPAAAELLTMKFEEMDKSTDNSFQAQFYEQFYSVFESPEAVMAVLLERKEEFAAQALENVMAQFLGISCLPAQT